MEGITNLNTGKRGIEYIGSNPVIPTGQEIIIPEKTYFKRELVIQGDSDLKPKNIKNGVSIYNIEGNYSYDINEDPIEMPYCWSKNEVNGTGSFSFLFTTDDDGVFPYVNTEQETLPRGLIKESDFYGFELSYTSDYYTAWVVLNADHTMTYKNSYGNSTPMGSIWWWDASNQILKKKSGDSSSERFIGTLTIEDLTRIEYILSNSSNLYSDNQISNGYRYLKVIT